MEEVPDRMFDGQVCKAEQVNALFMGANTILFTIFNCEVVPIQVRGGVLLGKIVE